MTARRFRSLALVFVALATARAGDPVPAPEPQRLADRYLAAFRSGDEGEMAAVAAKSLEQACFDPYLVAHDLLTLHADAALADPPRADDALAAARDLARRVSVRPRNATLGGTIDGWSRLTAAQLRAESQALDEANEIVAALHRGEASRCADDADRLRAVAAGCATEFARVRLLLQLADAQARAGRTRLALETSREVESSAERASWPYMRASAIWQQGTDEFRLGDVREARELWRTQVELLAAIGETDEAAESLLSIADANEVLGEYAEALRLTERAVALAESSGNDYNASLALAQSGGLCALLGDAPRALATLDEARRRFTLVRKSDVGGAWTLSLLGRTYAGLGLHDRAVAAYEQALAEMASVRGYVREVAAYRSELGRLYAEIGRLDRAAELQERAARDLESAGERVGAAESLARLGELQSQRGLHDKAVATLGHALAELESIGDRGGAARARAGLARARAASGDTAGALREAQTALGEMTVLGDRMGASRVLRDLAGLSRALGRPDSAVSLARRAVETPLALGTGLGEEDATGLRRDARSAADEGVLAACDLLASPAGAPGAAAAAYWFAESSRGLSLAEGIVNRSALVHATVSPALRDADVAARDRVAALRSRLAETAARPGAAPQAIDAARADLDSAYLALGESAARVQREARRVADVVYPRPVELRDLQASLDPATAMVLYHLTPERAVAVAVTHDSVRLVDLGAAAELTARVQDFVDLVSVEGSADEEKAARLYEAILRPLEPETAGRARLVVSPDGPLTFLPLEALVRTDGARRERVVERWEVAYVPSATVSVALRDDATRAGSPGHGIVALGDPVYPGEGAAGDAGLRRFGRLRRLPGTAAEVGALGELVASPDRTLLLREAATAADLRAALAARPGRLAALHLACHGRVDTARPRLTGLALTGGEILSLDDIHRMNVPADLVVLSACDTGRGQIVLGEGAMNLARGFLFAGASRVVVSDWSVSDAATQTLMVSLYTKMLRDGLPPGQALRAAKLGMLRSGGPFAHPAHWAAFVIWGG